MTMKYRQLTKEEKELNSKQIKRFKERASDIENYLIPKAELEINFGIEKSFRDTMNQYKQELQKIKEELMMKKENIKILTEQNEKGVPEKDNPAVG